MGCQQLCFRCFSPRAEGLSSGSLHSGETLASMALTIHSSRTRFAGRLNSGVRRHMKWLAATGFSALSLFSAGSLAGKATTCTGLDPETISCPAPQAPRITELRRGNVVVRLTIQRDGTVANVVVVSASGHPAWKEAVLQAVKAWRYEPSGKLRSITIPFEMTFE
ncbi:hypothetical protein C0063_06310 [Pseudoxanthomonas sp. KAs_5_3]|nr:hypothetical protein C0063_06310 [Pseudoxanthomonas sp. KAs_5_3]